MSGRALPSGEPRSHFVVLALLQVALAIESFAYLLMPSDGKTTTWLNLAVGAALLALAGVTLLVLPRARAPLLDTVIATTWILLAVIVGTRATVESLMLMALSLLLLTVYVCYCRPRRLAIAHAAGMMVAVSAAVLVSAQQSTLFTVAWVVLAVVVTAWVVIALRERDRHLQLLVENSADVVFHTRDGIFVWVSRSSLDVLGWDGADLVGTRKLDLWHPDDRERALDLRNRTRDGQVSRETMRLRRPDGNYLWIEATLRPYTDAYGYPGISGSLRDVSDRVAIQGALAESENDQRELAERLANSAEMQSRLVQNISHEFRTPLTVIRAPLQRLSRRGPDLGDVDRSEVEAALRASRRMTTLVDDLIDVARSGTGGEVTIRESVDVPAATLAALDPFRPACDASGIDLSLDVRDVPVPLWLHEDAWTRIVSNLVSNSVRFTESGSIHVRLEYDEPWLCVEVADTGIGIAEQDRDAIFADLAQGRRPPVRASAQTGVGIGLAVVRELTNDLDGECHIESVESEGTRAVVRVRAPRVTVIESTDAFGDGGAGGHDGHG